MATSTISKRSTRLNAYDLPEKTVPGRRLRSRKVITVNEDSSETKAITRSKKLYVVIDDVSPRKHGLTKSHNNSHNKLNKRKKLKKSINEEEQKEMETRKKKRSGIISSSINKNKHKIFIKEKKSTNHSTKLRQTSLQESFKQQSAKCLRPRRNKVNYCDDSKLLQQHVPLQHHDSVVILSRIDSDNTKKVPVYKTIKISEQSLENQNDVYDFKYDSDDRKEKLAKKKKKRKNIKVKSKLLKKNVQKKVRIEIKPTNNEADKYDSNANSPMEIIQCNSPLQPVVVSPLPESIKKNSLGENLLKKDKEIIEIPSVDTNVQEIEETSVEQIKKPNVEKPRIISIENAANITITKAPPGSAKDILPFRTSSNIFNRRSTIHCRNTLNSSLLVKSLSPISKEYNTFDPGSPWRPPQLPYMFSYGKHFVQSTPNEAQKVDTIYKKRIVQIKDNSHNADKVANVNDTAAKNINTSLQNLSDNKVGYKNNSNMCRKFGTEITNIEYINNCTMIQNNNIEVVNEKPATETETNSVTNVQLDKIASPLSNSPSIDDTGDKENMAANYQTPKKLTKKKLKKRQLSNMSPTKTYENKNIVQSENVDPQPGPSGMRVPRNYDEQRILQQSNLNNFLNIMDMPENTRINTKHGIFGDVHSSPVSNSAIKKAGKPAMRELENAFGFCENDIEINASPTKNLLVNEVKEIYAKKPLATQAPVRLSLGELRNNLLQKKLDKKVADHQQATKQQNIEASKSPEAEKNNRLVDVINFSDTFDVLSESEKMSTCEASVPLFVDLEPSHFIKPPQHSYKRKRDVTLNFSNDSDDEEIEKVKTYAKKKKLSKVEKEHKKRLDDWVKNVNSTFQEIDEHDLLIE